MKLALVNAPALGNFESWMDTPDFPRTALACLAAYIRENSLHTVKCIDAKFDRLSFQQTVDTIIDFEPDLVGYTAFTNEIKPSAYLAAKIKEINPAIFTLIGGAHFSALPQKTLMEFPSFDGGVVGDGEESLLEICEAIESKLPLHGIKGLVFRDRELIVSNPARPRILDMDKLPLPAWDMFRPAKQYWIQTSRGCPFNCHFCMNHNGRVARKRSVERTIEEFSYLITNYHPEWIRIGDEMFTVDMERSANILDALAETGLGALVKWDVQTHVRYVNRDLFKKFKQAGVTQIDMGVESGEENILKNIGKGTSIKMIKDAFRIAHAEGIKTGSLLLIGQPYETKETVLKTINLAVDINSSIPMYGIMVPYPGTEVARMAAKGEGGYKNMSFDWDDFGKQIGSAIDFEGISRKQIELLQFWGYLKVFLWNFRFFDLARFIWNYRTGGFGILKKLFSRSNSISSIYNKVPKDYKKVLSSDYRISYDDMIYSKTQFEIIQKEEIKRTKKEMPELLSSQMPLDVKVK